MFWRIILVFGILQFVRAQNNLIIFSSLDEKFRIQSAQLPVNDSMQHEIKVNGISDDTLWVKIITEKSQLNTTLFLLEKSEAVKNREFIYALERDRKNGGLKLVFISNYSMKPLPDPLLPPKPVIDTSYKWRNNVFGTLFELKNGKVFFYDNIKQITACEKAMPEDNMAHALKLLARTQVDSDKYKHCYEIVKNNCLNCSQLSQLLKALNFELDKIKLVKEAYPNVTDKENFKSLESFFRFESSKKEFKELAANTHSLTKKAPVNCYKPISDSLHKNLLDQLRMFDNDYHRVSHMREKAVTYCFTCHQFVQCLNVFLHDREKLELSKEFIYHLTDKENIPSLYTVFSYNESKSALKEYIQQQKK
jgi:hypothetical protein